MRKRKLLFLSALLLQVILFSKAGLCETGTISGAVYDHATKQAIEYATISLYSADNDSLITGTITNAKGKFVIKDVLYGKYKIAIAFLGYKEKQIKNLNITPEKVHIIIPDCFLETDTRNIDEIQIVGKDREVDFKIDKKVITVGENLASASLSAIDVMESLPSIKVDIDGTVSLRGNTGFTVLIDGKPSVLDAGDALSQIPASMIKNIEIITNPSAKYRPDGVGGIINIITKKNNTTGWQGMVSTKVGSHLMYGSDLMLSYKGKNYTISASADISESPRPGASYTERRTSVNDSLKTVIEDGTSLSNRERYRVKAGIEWDITEKDFFSFESQAGDYENRSESDADYQTFYNYKSDTVNETDNSISGRRGEYYKFSAAYSHSFKKEKHELILQSNYRYRNSDEWSETMLYDDLSNIYSGTRTTESGPSKRFDIKADYTLPLKKEQIFESGLLIRCRQNTDNTGVYSYDTLTDEFTETEDKQNTYDYKRNIYASYLIYKGSHNKIGYQFGTRVEYTDRSITSNEETDEYSKQLWDVFPSLHLSYERSKKNQFMTSYSRRIDRPHGYTLEPFLTWTDMYNVRKGNPDLQPEYIDAVEAAYICKKNKRQISMELYYHRKQNKIERIKSVYNADVVLTEFKNIGTDHALGLEGMFNSNRFKFWDFSVLGNVYYYRIEDDEDEDNTSVNWSTRINNTFSIVKTLKLQINGVYNSPTATSQGKDFADFSINAAVRADFFKRSLSAVLQVRDVFATDERSSVTEEEDLYIYRSSKNFAPYVTLSVSYKFNNYKMKKDSDKGEDDDF